MIFQIFKQINVLMQMFSKLYSILKVSSSK